MNFVERWMWFTIGLMVGVAAMLIEEALR